ncbi:uncharacterized protein ASCRUDRAFT_101802 [Ascoidea rubescens DSM 1968]|uniref:Uncharacterized protein n=1 Tax=Ascoidea rubescens DSM 1968 TaxID=1344418 RepID=A0A1D2VR54_9ASCO|nr:hypothetical protein ASCRUDRAFT_101802 [Ascoidea rubescens DSM 1968]ODV64055.1 hypothetical protein ASCRUDRAFT_101802 [Ascoidea rubescens DSM 1968]
MSNLKAQLYGWLFSSIAVLPKTCTAAQSALSLTKAARPAEWMGSESLVVKNHVLSHSRFPSVFAFYISDRRAKGVWTHFAAPEQYGLER